jgi:hypothetical protein
MRQIVSRYLARALSDQHDLSVLADAPNLPHRSPEVIRLAVMMSVGSALALRQAEDFHFERGIDI